MAQDRAPAVDPRFEQHLGPVAPEDEGQGLAREQRAGEAHVQLADALRLPVGDLLQELVADFEGLKDVTEYASRAAALGRDKKVRDAIKQERREEDQEARLIGDIMAAEARLANPEERLAAMQELRDRWKQMRTAANGASDTAERRVARRISRALLASANDRTRDPEYRKLLEEQRALFPRGR